MMLLNDILPHKYIRQVVGNSALEIAGLALDSRAVTSNFVFAAIKGTQVDGHRFITTAIANGATCILAQELPDQLTEGVCYLLSDQPSIALGYLASAFYEHPTADLKVIGVTGTNGKTSIATLLKNCLTSLGYQVGLLSTIQIEIGEEILPSTHTTPHAIAIQSVMHTMVEKGCDYVIMEVSSHAAHQQRIAGIRWTGGIFTNLSHDHLDYHKTYDHYIKSKKSFFDGLPTSAFALSNKDDKNGAVMFQNCQAKKAFYSVDQLSEFKAKVVEQDLTGMHLHINDKDVYARLSGRFNAYNITAVYAALRLLGFESEESLVALSEAKGATGRMDWVKNKENIIGIVDYAHTPDALLNVLTTLKQLNSLDGNIITVVGCGGNRDQEKRPKMAHIASEYSNQVILTSDNPRDEEPNLIIQQMEAGIPLHKRLNTLTIEDRKSAIKTACSLAKPNDLILVAGKGHELYQEIKGIKTPFNDKAFLQDFLQTENI